MPVLTAGRVAAVLATGASARRDAGAPPRFKPGDPVAVRNLNPVGHTRIPRYIRGRRGIIECDYGIFVYPDDHALEQGETLSPRSNCRRRQNRGSSQIA